MKVCPLCKLKFEDSAEFCPSCKAQLEDYKEAQKQEKQKIPKAFWISLLAALGFIGTMVLIYNLIYGAFAAIS